MIKSAQEAMKKVEEVYPDSIPVSAQEREYTIFDEKVKFFLVRCVDESAWFVKAINGEVLTAQKFWQQQSLRDRHAW